MIAIARARYLMNQFVAVSLITSALFWSILGGLSGYFFHRFENA